MSENVSSNVLFHFTTSMGNLKGILKNGFCPRYCPEYSLDPADRRAASKRHHPIHAAPMVCFCDLPLSLIRKHLTEYGPFGIGLDKQWGIKNGITPVIYTHPTAQTRQPLSRLVAKAGKSNDRAAANDMKMLAAYTKPFVGPAWRKNRVRQRVRFYDEREWRYVPEPLFLDWKEYRDESRRSELHNRFRKQYALEIDPDAIEYLIVPYDRDEDNILELHDCLTRIYRRKDAVLVSTAIMTDNCIEEDV